MSIPPQEEMGYAHRIDIERPPRDLISIGLAWTGGWSVVVMIGRLIAMRAQLPNGGAVYTAGYIVGIATAALTSFVLAGLVGGAVLGASVAFVRTDDDNRTTRAQTIGSGAIAGAAASLSAMWTHSTFPRLPIPQLTVPFHAIVGAALAVVLVGLFHRYRRAERDELVEEMRTFHRDRMRQEEVRILSQRQTQPATTTEEAGTCAEVVGGGNRGGGS